MQGVGGSGRAGAWDWMWSTEASAGKQLVSTVSAPLAKVTSIELEFKLADEASKQIKSVSGGIKSLAGCV